MGQQQLMLAILVTVIVGIATIVAMNTMLESRKSSNRDAVQQDILLIINDAENYFFRPSMLGGGGNSFDNISIDNISIGSSTENGSYTLSGSGNTLDVEGTGTYEGVYLKATVTMESNNRFNVTWADEQSPS